ncbi:MAG: hypothetical protein M0Z50_07550 [Planctomycetia bacterium]|nr:hypothetical protein [Planctomycetia bacterium]
MQWLRNGYSLCAAIIFTSGLAGCTLREFTEFVAPATRTRQSVNVVETHNVHITMRKTKIISQFHGIWAWCGGLPNKKLINLLPILYIHNRDYSHPAAMARKSQQLPAGRAAIFLWNAAPNLLTCPQNTCRTPEDQPTHFPSPWLSAGAAQIQARMAAFFRRYKAAGGRLNYLVLDYEAGLTSWQLKLPDIQAIEHDPRSTELTAQLGFPYLSSIFFPGPNRRKWNLQMGQRVAKALNTAFFQPARMSFPDIAASNFNGLNMRSPYIVPDINNHYQPCACVFGNCQSPALYGDIGGLAYASPGGRPYGKTPFAILRYELMYLQGVQRSSNLPVVPWVAYKHYGKIGIYYKELIYQIVMRGCNQLLYFNPSGKNGVAPGDNKYLNQLLSNLKNKLGNNPSMTVSTDLIRWNNSLLVAARHCSNGQVLYRLSVPPGTREVEELPNGYLINTAGKTGVWRVGHADETFHILK